jgi:hypothetical protein
MRIAALALMSVLALGACNPSVPAGSQNADAGGAAGSAFPNIQNAAYRAEGNIMHDGQAIPIVMIRSGQKLRMEINTPEGQSIIVSDGETGESFMIAHAGGRQMALRTTEATQQFADPAASWGAEIAATATRTGDCQGAGQHGTEWTRTENGVVKTACVTQDGIMLLATDNGNPVWETTNVQRGPQPAELFTVPPGVQLMDLNNIPGMAEAMERMRGAGSN